MAAASRRSAERQHKDGRHSCRARRPGTGAAVPDPQGLQHRRRRRPNRPIAPMAGAAHDCPSCHRSPRLAQCPQPSMGSAHPAPEVGRADRAHCHRTHWTNCPAVAMNPNATVSGSVSTRYSGESWVLLRHVQDEACIEREHDGPRGPRGLLRRRGGRRGRGRGIRARRGPGGPESERRTGPVGPRRIMSHEYRGSPAASGTWNLCRRRPERSTAAGSGSGEGQVRAKANTGDLGALLASAGGFGGRDECDCCCGWSGWVAVVGVFEVPVGHLAFDDTGVGALPAGWQESFQQLTDGVGQGSTES
ncbi:hypothetical protein ACVWZD_005886 [Streptomyces sp. TE3672]